MCKKCYKTLLPAFFNVRFGNERCKCKDACYFWYWYLGDNCQLKEEALYRTMWRNRFGRGFGPVVWQNTDDDDDLGDQHFGDWTCLRHHVWSFLRSCTSHNVQWLRGLRLLRGAAERKCHVNKSSFWNVLFGKYTRICTMSRIMVMFTATAHRQKQSHILQIVLNMISMLYFDITKYRVIEKDGRDLKPL